MPRGFSRHLKDSATHWPVTGSDGFGGFLFGAPVLLRARWEDKAELFLTDNKEEEVSKSVVYLEVDVSTGDYLSEGDHATTPVSDPSSLTTAHRIRQHGRSTDLRSMQQLHKVYL